MPLYDFKCANGHTTELVVSYEKRDDPAFCSLCGDASTRQFPLPHVPPDGVYSYAPNVGCPERFERQRHAIKNGIKTLDRTPPKGNLTEI